MITRPRHRASFLVMALGLGTLSSLSLACKQHGPPLPPQGELLIPHERPCGPATLGATQVVVAFDKTAATSAAMKVALSIRARDLATCEATLIDHPDGLELVLPGVDANDPGLRALAVRGEIWVSPWISAAPKFGDTVKRPPSRIPLRFSKVHVVLDSAGVPAVSGTLTTESSSAFADLTKRYVGKLILLAADEQALMAPIVREPINEGRILIQMGASAGGQDAQMKEASRLVRVLRGPPLPQSATLQPPRYTPPQ